MAIINFRTKPIIILLHILIWLEIILLPTQFMPKPPGNDFHPEFQVSNIIFNLLSILLFYINVYLLIPRFFKKKKWGLYIIVMIALEFAVIMISIASKQFEGMPRMEFHGGRPREFFIFPALLFWAIGTAFGTVIHFSREKREAENENLKTELLFLRSQINPHFLFNTLNNLVSLARKKSDLLEPSLIKLSGLMYYMLYESNNENVPIQQETEYLRNFIELQRLRFGQEVSINLDLEANINSSLEIPPMILIPYVENAFKHGVGLIENPEINISLKVEGTIITFIVTNKFDPDSEEEKDNSSGIGLTNARRRLELLFPGKHDLQITITDNWYIVRLILQL